MDEKLEEEYRKKLDELMDRLDAAKTVEECREIWKEFRTEADKLKKKDEKLFRKLAKVNADFSEYIGLRIGLIRKDGSVSVVRVDEHWNVIEEEK